MLFLAVVIHAQAPTPNFSASVSSGCSPLVVDFKDLSTGNPTSYFWDFGNGATAQGDNVKGVFPFISCTALIAGCPSTVMLVYRSGEPYGRTLRIYC